MTNIEAMEYVKESFINSEPLFGLCRELQTLYYNSHISAEQLDTLRACVNKHAPKGYICGYYFRIRNMASFNPLIHDVARADICAKIIDELKQQTS